MKDGSKLLSGGFGLCGVPFDLIDAIKVKGVKNLHIVSNNAGTDNTGLGILVSNGQVTRSTASYVGENKTFEKL